MSLYYYIRVVVFMWIKDEAAGSEPIMSPTLALVLVVAVVGTLAMGIYPRPLFELADWSGPLAGRGGRREHRRPDQAGA